MINEREVPPPNDPLLRLVQREGTFWVPLAQNCDAKKGDWQLGRTLKRSVVDEVYIINYYLHTL